MERKLTLRALPDRLLSVATCKHSDFEPKLVDSIQGLEPTLFCKQPRFIVNSLQTSGLAHIICKSLSQALIQW
jgi:hypothetical protein